MQSLTNYYKAGPFGRLDDFISAARQTVTPSCMLTMHKAKVFFCHLLYYIDERLVNAIMEFSLS